MTGFIDSLTNAFTGDPIKAAAQKQRDYLSGVQATTNQNLATGQSTGLDALKSGTYSGVNAIGSGVDTARGDISGSTDPALSALYGGANSGTNALTGSVTPAIAALSGGVSGATSAYGGLDSLSSQYAGYTGQASDASADALGLNGPEGVARAQQSFQAGPGFQFGLNRGLESIARNANRVGMGASGNTLQASQEFGQGLANQEWDKYLANLKGREGLYAPLALSGTGASATGRANAALTGGTAAAGIYSGTGGKLSDLLSRTGTAGAGIYTGEGSNLADLASRGGLAEGGLYNQGGQSQAQLISQLLKIGTGFNKDIAAGIGSTYGAEGQAEMTGSNNLWNLIGGTAKAAVAL